MIEGVLFDMDGVLIDSEPIILQAAISYFSSIGVTVQPEDFIPFIGAGEKRFLCGVAEKYGITLDFEQARDTLFTLYDQVAQQHPGAMDGVHRFIRNARASGLKLALATSAARRKADINLKVIGLHAEDFDTVVTGDLIKRNKPNPDIYQLAALSMGLPTQECLVVEDAVNGILAAKAAGCSVCAVATTFSAPVLAEAGAHYVLSSLDAFEDFTSVAGFNELLSSYTGEDDRIVYGANRIHVAPAPLMGNQALLDLAIKQALAAWEHAYAPYSNYKVGASVVSAATNRVYSGCNVENSSFGATICAERNAILHAIATEGVIGVSLLVVVSEDAPPAPPCAHCLQVFAEFTHPETPVHLMDVDYAEGKGGAHLVYRFGDLLPHPFIFPSMRS